MLTIQLQQQCQKGIVISYTHIILRPFLRSHQARTRKLKTFDSVPCPLVDAASVAAISTVHAASASSLEARTPGQASTELHKGSRNLVTHCSVALVVVNWGSAGTVGTVSPGGLGGSGSSSGSSTTVSGSSLGSKESGLQTRTSGAAGGAWCRGVVGAAGSAGSGAAHERHIDDSL